MLEWLEVPPEIKIDDKDEALKQGWIDFFDISEVQLLAVESGKANLECKRFFFGDEIFYTVLFRCVPLTYPLHGTDKAGP